MDLLAICLTVLCSTANANQIEMCKNYIYKLY